MWTRAELKKNAKEKLRRYYGKLVIAAIVLTIATFGGKSGGGSGGREDQNQTETVMTLEQPQDILNLIEQNQVGTLLGIIAISLVIGEVISIFILHPLEIGARKNFLIATKQEPEMYELASGFAFNYKNVIKTMFFRDLKLVLWSILLIVPGIVKGYEYRMVPYLLAENPSLDGKEAFALSKKMMDGEKMNSFLLDLSFIGWFLLSVMTLFIAAVFWVNPYYDMTCTELFITLKEKHGEQLQFVPPLHHATEE